jgi:hypothetical protein
MLWLRSIDTAIRRLYSKIEALSGFEAVLVLTKFPAISIPDSKDELGFFPFEIFEQPPLTELLRLLMCVCRPSAIGVSQWSCRIRANLLQGSLMESSALTAGFSRNLAIARDAGARAADITASRRRLNPLVVLGVSHPARRLSRCKTKNRPGKAQPYRTAGGRAARGHSA